MAAKNCKQGYGCGDSCITRTKDCSIGTSPDISAILSQYGHLVVQVNPKPQLVTPIDKLEANPKKFLELKKLLATDYGDDYIPDAIIPGSYYSNTQDAFYSERNGLIFQDIPIVPDSLFLPSDKIRYDKAKEFFTNEWDGKPFREVGWGLSEPDIEELDDKQRVQQGLKAKRTLKELRKAIEIPENAGMVLYNNPVGGKNGVRARIYKKLGFSESSEVGNIQLAYVNKEGKLVPLNLLV